MEHVGKSITKDWAQQLEGINRASEIVVICPVGEIARTDGTERARPMSGTID